MQKLLFRKVGSSIRYYKIVLQKSLFGEYLLERVYGNIANKAPTGKKIAVFDDYKKAKKIFEKIIRKKYKKGYKHFKEAHLFSSSP